MPRLSIVVGLFNRLELTRAMLAGLAGSLPPGLSHEVILVDDASTDGTGEWLDSLREPFRVVRNPENRGFAAANNRGAALASGEWLALLNNDLVLSPGWLEPMLAAHRSLGALAGVVGNVQISADTGAWDHSGIFINHKGKPEHMRRRPPPWSRIAPVRRVPAVTGACVVIRRDLWNLLGGFDEAFVNGCEDVDLCLRASAAGRLNAVALRSVVGHHVSASPGRKLRDESNTRLLTLRWRETLVPLGARSWCSNYLRTYFGDPRDYPDQALARQAVAYLAHARRSPPAGALEGMRAAIEVELARWKDILG